MPLFDLLWDDLKAYKPNLTRSNTFQGFWEKNIKEAREQPLNSQVSESDYFSSKVKVHKVTFDGFEDKTPVVGRFIKSAEKLDKTPVIVSFHGYGSSKGTVSDFLGWVLLGFSVFSVDIRGQAGEVPDYARYSTGNITGNMTKGILNPAQYYYKYVFMDCYRAIDYVLTRDDVDGNRLGVTGHSQGGGLSLVMAALHKKVSLTMASVPYLCNFGRAIYVAQQGPYLEILAYLRSHPDDVNRVMDTLSYFDAMNFAPDIKVPTLMSVGLVDPICPPSTIFAAYHHIGATNKELAVFPGMAHEELNVFIEKKMKLASSHLLP